MVEITQDDIDNGYRNHHKRCPLSLAVKRKLNRTDVSVHARRLYVGTEVYDIPRAARNWLYAFDTNQPVSPITFNIFRGAYDV